MSKNLASVEDIYSEIEPDYDMDEDDESAEHPVVSVTASDTLRSAPGANLTGGKSSSEESLRCHSEEAFVVDSVMQGTLRTSSEYLSSDPGTGKSSENIQTEIEQNPDGRRRPGRFRRAGMAADPERSKPDRPSFRAQHAKVVRHSGMDQLHPDMARSQQRKKSDFELEIEEQLVDDPEFGESLNEMIRQHQVRRSLTRKRGRTQRWSSRSSARSASSDGSRRGSRRGEDFLDIYRSDSAPATKADIKDNLKIQQDILANIRAQPWRMKRKLVTLRLAKCYVQRYEGHLSRSRGYQEAGAKFWRKLKRIFTNFAIIFIPWEMRIKKIESHFGSVVSSYFTFLRWLVGVNIILALITTCFIVVPEILVGKPRGSTPAKSVPPNELSTALNLMTIIDFEGYLKYSVLFYGFYGSQPVIGDGYRLPLAYFLAGLSTLALSFVIILKRMAYNSRLGRMSSKDEQYTFSWRLFTNWDYMIGNTETAKNKAAEIVTNFRELILEEQEKKRKENKKLLVLLRIVANILVITVLASSSYAIVLVVERSRSFEKKIKQGQQVTWYERNEVSIVMSLITALYPSIFDLIGLMEKYHPRINLRWQLARILVLYLLNMYTLIIALYNKIRDLESSIVSLSPTCNITVQSSPTKVIQNVTSDWLIENNTIVTSTPAPNQNCSLPKGDPDPHCWETMIGQEIMKLTAFDTAIAIAFILLIDFFRGLWVRYCNAFWCWDLETKFPEYGEFKIAENILHLIYNQAMVWLGTFFSPVLPLVNIFKLLIMLYIRSWAVLMCNIPHERVFKASRSNNFYFALLLLMLFLVTIPIMYLLVMVKPSLECGPFSGLEKSYQVFTQTIEEEFPPWLNTVVEYIASPGVIFPLFLLMAMAIFYMISLSRSYKEANRDLRVQLHYERTEEKRKIYAMADERAKKSFVRRQKRWKGVNDPLLSSKTDAAARSATSGTPTNNYGSFDRQREPEAERTPKGSVQVIRVPNITREQADALKRYSPNVHVITTSEARTRGLLPEEGSSDRHQSKPATSRSRDQAHITPPVAIVQGKPLTGSSYGSTDNIILQHGSMQHLLD